jgi:hypothetical protein
MPTDDPKDAAISIRKSEMMILGDETAKRERNSETMMRGLVSNFSLRLVMNVGRSPQATGNIKEFSP